MKFKIDENLPIEIVQILNEAEYDAMSILDQNLGGKADIHVASRCQNEKRILVTLDMDFADIRTYPPNQYSGLIVLRLKRQDKPYILKIFSQLLQFFPKKPIDHHLWIVEENKIRIRS